MTSDSPSFEELEIEIKELKKQNELLRQNQRQSQIVDIAQHLLFENSYLGNLIIDINGIYLGSNHRAAEALGSTPSQIIGKSIFDFLPYVKASAYLQKNKDLIEKGISAKYEDTFHLGMGEKTFLISDQVLKDEFGNGYALLSSSIDITERKQAEESLRESEKLYRLLVRNLPGTSVFLFNNNLQFILVEGYLHPEFGYTTSDMEGKMIWEILSEDQAARLAPIYKKALQGIPTENLISEYKGHSYSVNILPVKNKKGKIIAGMVVSQDITDRKLTEVALRHSEEKWRKLVHTIPDYVALYDHNGKYLFLNHFAEGFSAKDIEGKNYTDFLAEESKKLYDETFRKAKETKETQYNEYTAFGDNYSIRNYESFFVPIFENDVLVNMLVIARDISSRKTIEKRLAESEANARAIMESTDDVLVLLDKNGILIDCNEAHARRLNKTREELLGKSIFDELPPELAKSRREAVNLCISTRECVYGEDFRLGRYIEYVVHPIFSENNVVEKVAIFALDATKRKQDEQILQDNEKRLRELNATKDKFFSIIAHDLKSPFNSIIGFSSLLARQIQEKDFASIEKYAGIIQNSSQQAMDLLMNLLEWSRSQTGRIVFTPENMNLADLIDQSIELFYGLAQQKSITISSRTPVNQSVCADKAMIHTILRNLISNAIKFTKAGGEITVSAEQMSNEVVVSVSDNGVGIDKESISKLFRIDQNYTTLGTEKEKGTGLGLLLCKEFIEKHSGRIWVESTPGKGSNFCFTIPETKIPNTSA